MSVDHASIEDLIGKKKTKTEGAAKDLKVQRTLSDVNRDFEEREAATKAQVLGYDYVNLHGFPLDKESLVLISHDEAKTAGLVAFSHESGEVKLGVVDPSQTGVARVREKLERQHYQVRLYLISKSSLLDGLAVYQKLKKAEPPTADLISLTQAEISQKAKKFVEASKLAENEMDKIDATELLAGILGVALSLGASDIHFEPERSTVHTRLRVDGVLQNLIALPLNTYGKILSRIKVLSHLKINVVTTPQDGSFSFKIDQTPVDFRVSVLPSIYGESLVVRILAQSKNITLDQLGVVGLNRQRLEEALKKTTGMILTTGPTGSGKTTTLYALLQVLNQPGTKIITVEDPVEYKIVGLSQTPIDRSRGMTFASGLRAILRQDPDIVMVGEIRDEETADVAIQASLTGHVVLSTLHTNDAVSIIPRLLDLHVKSFLITGSLNLGLAQRLVRRLCEHCKQADNPDEKILNKAVQLLKGIPATAGVALPQEFRFFHSSGCDQCNHTGYHGRLGIYESFVVTPELEKLILREAPLSALRQQAINDGMVSMAQDGLLKCLEGVTDVYEVFRVTD